MLPNITDIENTDNRVFDVIQDTQEQTQTFGLNMTKNIVGGKIDGLDALIQSIYLLLSVEADQYIIYPYTYGLKTLDLIGKPHYYVAAVIPDRIKEALLSDDRITDVSDFEFEYIRNKLNVKFIIHTIYGEDIAGISKTIGKYESSLPAIELNVGELNIALNSIIALQNSYINGNNDE